MSRERDQKLYAAVQEVRRRLIGTHPQARDAINNVQILVTDVRSVAQSSEWYNAIRVNADFINEAPPIFLRAVLAHEFGHAIRSHLQEWSDGQNEECRPDFLAAQIYGASTVIRSKNYIIQFREQHWPENLGAAQRDRFAMLHQLVEHPEIVRQPIDQLSFDGQCRITRPRPIGSPRSRN